MLGIELLKLFYLPYKRMSGILGKDERAKLIAEFEQGKELSNPNYYCVKDKNDKIMLRKVKPPKPELSEIDKQLVKAKKAMQSIEATMTSIAEQVPRVQPAPENNPVHKEVKARAL